MGCTVMNPLLTLLEVYKNQVQLFFKHPAITMQANLENHAIDYVSFSLVYSHIHATQVCG
jgi:hypothetical protein